MKVHRWPALVLIPALLIAGALLDRRDRGSVPSTEEDPAVDAETPEDIATPPMPQVDPADASSSTWYCSSGTGSGNAVLTRQVVVVANTSDDRRTGQLTLFPDEGEPVEQALDVAGRSRVAINTTDLTDAPSASALVELEGGGVAVSQLVDGPAGRDVAECATSASDVWHVASGATTADAALFYAVFNPFPDEAIVDMTFETDDGSRNPEPFQGFVIPGGSVRFVDVGQVVTRRSQVSATITARTGRVVVDRIQSFGGQEGVDGLSVSLAETEPAETWFFPAGPSGEGLSERYVVYNPTDEPAEVDLAVALDDPDTNGAVEPFELSVPRRSFVVLTSGDEQWGRVPAGVGHSVVIRSLNGVPVVTERTLIAQDPANNAGSSTTAGIPVTGSTLVIATGDLQAAEARVLSIQNPNSDETARVVVTALVEGEAIEFDPIDVAEGGRVTVRLDDLTEREGYVLVLESNRPIVAEEGYRFDDPSDRGAVRALPLIGTTEIPSPFAAEGE